MALNKAHTSLGMKIGIIILIVAFVSLFMYQGLYGLVALFQQNSGTTASSTVDPLTAINTKHQADVTFLKQQLASDPTSYTANLNLANGYFDWAQELSQPSSGQSQLTTAAMAAAFQQWTAAKQAYDAATKLAKTLDPAAQTDRSYAALYSNDATEAIKIVKVVTEQAPTFAQAWVHLGIYYEAVGNTRDAVPAYQRYLQLDPKGNNVAYVQQRLKALGATATSATSGTTSGSTSSSSTASTKTP